MKAAVLTAPNRIETREVPSPIPSEGEVLVRIREAGICGTDYAVFSGSLDTKFPIIPGHEAAGEVVAIGTGVEGIVAGQHVTIQPNFPCKQCPVCLAGKENICPNKVRLGLDVDGVFAEYVAVPYRYAWPLPPDLSFSHGSLAEPLAVALHAIKKNPPSKGEKVLVYGAGTVGLLVVRLAVLAKAHVSVLDIVPSRLKLALELGADETFLSRNQVEPGSFSVAYETSGTGDAFHHLINLCAPGGHIVLTGLPKDNSSVSTNSIVRKELRIEGSMIYINEFSEAVQLLQSGVMKADLFITGIHPLEELSIALRDFQSPDRVKTLIRIG